MLKKIKSFVSFFLIPALILSVFQAVDLHSVFADEPADSSQTSIYVNTEWPSYPSIYAEAGVLIDAASGTVLYEKLPQPDVSCQYYKDNDHHAGIGIW